jgi:hypothetical protein
MQPHAAVARRDDVSALGPPRLGHAVDRTRIELRPVGEHDERSLRSRGKGSEPATERGAGAALPVGAGNALHVEWVRAAHDDDPVDAAPPERVEHAREELDLLRRRDAVARGRAGGQDDRVDQLQPASAAQRCWTFAMYVCVSGQGAPPALSTAVGPALYAASARSVRE